jgi:hypothetical protein
MSRALTSRRPNAIASRRVTIPPRSTSHET